MSFPFNMTRMGGCQRTSPWRSAYALERCLGKVENSRAMSSSDIVLSHPVEGVMIVGIRGPGCEKPTVG